MSADSFENQFEVDFSTDFAMCWSIYASNFDNSTFLRKLSDIHLVCAHTC